MTLKRREWRRVWHVPESAPDTTLGDIEYEAPDEKRLYMFPHRYVLELFKGDDNWLEDSITLRHINQVTMSAPTSVSRRFTLTSIDEQHSGVRERVFSISGRSGNLPDQISLFHHNRNFIEKYLRLKRDNENAFQLDEHYKLIINFPWEGERFFCTITNFSYNRDVSQNPHSYQFSLEIRTHGYAGIRWGDTFNKITDYNSRGIGRYYRQRLQEKLERRLKELADQRELEERIATTQYEQEEDAHLDGTDGVKLKKAASESELTRGLKGEQSVASGAAITSRDVKNYQHILDGVQRAAESSGPDFLGHVTSAILAAEESWGSFWSGWVAQPLNEASRYRGVVSTFVSSFRNTATTFRAVAGRYYHTVPEWRAAISWYVSDVQASLNLYKDGITELGAMFTGSYWRDVFGGNRPTRAVASVITNSNTPVVATPVPPGTRSAFDVASTILGSRDRWVEIVEANNMRDAYTLGNGIPLEAGDLIMVPVPAGTSTGPSRDVFGTDLKVANGDLVLSGDGDFAVVTGGENVAQSMKHRLLTVRGTNKAFPSFGLQAAINERNTSTIYGLVWSDIRSQVASDIRVRAINKLAMTEERGGRYQVNLEYSLIGHSNNNIAFQYNVPL